MIQGQKYFSMMASEMRVIKGKHEKNHGSLFTESVSKSEAGNYVTSLCSSFDHLLRRTLVRSEQHSACSSQMHHLVKLQEKVSVLLWRL
jgi:hypothetical protein